MKITRLRTRLILGAVFICIVMAVTFMLAISWVISQQYLHEAQVHLGNASRIISENLDERQSKQLLTSRQLAAQKNLGSTIWYLAQYSRADGNADMLFVTYQQLVKDTCKMARVANLSRITIYNASGELVTFAALHDQSVLAGFVERAPDPVLQVAKLHEGEEFSRNNTQVMAAGVDVPRVFAGKMPHQESVHYLVSDGRLSIESYVPIMGEVFDSVSGKPQIRALGLVVAVQSLDLSFVKELSALTNTKINLFSGNELVAGVVDGYRAPDRSNVQLAEKETTPFNEIKVAGERFYQQLIPLYRDKQQIGSIATLISGEVVRKNTGEMIAILSAIAVLSLLFILPFAWYLAVSISRPITLLSGVFRGVASGKESLSVELIELESKRGDELGDLTQSFIAMNEAVKQKVQQIEEINTSLEDQINQRTRELRMANIELTKLASHDVLTGLPNRQLLSDRLAQSLVSARRDKNRVGLMFIDLDEFKPINDGYGHAVGDLLLLEVAKRIQGCIRESDTVSRIGGDEFVVLLPVIETERAAMEVADKIREAINQPLHLSDSEIVVSSSIGVSVYPEHGDDETILFKHADTAMYAAKNAGRNRVKLFKAMDVV